MPRDYKKHHLLLREELKEEIEKHYKNGSDTEFEDSLNAIVLKKIKKIKNDSSIDLDEKVKKFVSESFKDFIKSKDDSKKTIEGLVSLSKIESTLKIMHYLQHRIDKKPYDYYSVLLGYSGGWDFWEKKEKAPITTESVKEPKELNNGIKSNIVPPKIRSTLNDFFSNPCYLYAYDDSLEKVSGDIHYHIHYPSIDVLVLEYKPKDEEFILENIEGKAFHGTAKMVWNKESGVNIFTLYFEKSERDLEIRMFIPNKNYKINKIEVLLGKFISSYIDGAVVTGSIIIQKNGETESKITPYKHEYKAKKNKGRKQKPPLAIQRYLFEKEKNWHKTPSGDITSLKELSNWLDYKKTADSINKKDLTARDFLIMFPRTSYSNNTKKNLEVENKLRKSIKEVVRSGKFQFTEELLEKYQDKGFDDSYVNYSLAKLKEYYRKKYVENELVIYSEIVKRDSVKNLFSLINSSFHVIFVIPKANYEKTSAIYTIIGKCLALKKKVFIFFENENEVRPNYLSKNIRESSVKEDNIQLFVHHYQKLSDIPSKILLNYTFENWNNYLEELKEVD